MRTFVRSIGVLLAAGVLVAACGASATPSPVATSAPPATIAPTPPPSPSPSAKPDPTATPVASVEPMAPAYVTGTGHIDATISSGTTTKDGDVTRITGAKLATTGTLSDPRVTGKATMELSVATIGNEGFEWGTMRIENAGGAWEGPCTGGIWSDGNASDHSCWLVGSGAYKGLTFYLHNRSTGYDGDLVGVILPVAAPPMR